jgi:hypothetical protein
MLVYSTLKMEAACSSETSQKIDIFILGKDRGISNIVSYSI